MEPKARRVLREFRGFRAIRDRKESKESKEFRVIRESKAIPGPREFRAIPDRKESKEFKEFRGLREILEQTERMEPTVHRVLRESRESRPLLTIVTKRSGRCVLPTELLLPTSFPPSSPFHPPMYGFK
jgi:hypothetical protein